MIYGVVCTVCESLTPGFIDRSRRVQVYETDGLSISLNAIRGKDLCTILMTMMANVRILMDEEGEGDVAEEPISKFLFEVRHVTPFNRTSTSSADENSSLEHFVQ
jgi:hypothetical protein